MPLKIFGGALKGHSLKLPPDSVCRPTSALLRRKLFDRFQSFEGMSFLDVCSGSGSVALEALSRGAEHVICLENNRKVLPILKSNIAELSRKVSASQTCSVITGPAQSSLSAALKEMGGRPLVVFIDPPYEELSVYQGVVSALQEQSESETIKQLDEIWIEGDRLKGDVGRHLGGSFKTIKQGDHYVMLFDRIPAWNRVPD